MLRHPPHVFPAWGLLEVAPPPAVCRTAAGSARSLPSLPPSKIVRLRIASGERRGERIWAA
jgi:hypothetical protein